MKSLPESVNRVTKSDPLARRLAAGDPDAPGQLVERHHAELYRYALALLRDASVAEDIVQGTFENAFTALGKYPEDRIEALRLRPWLFRIALNLVRNAWRDRHREEPTAETLEGSDGHLGVSFAFASGTNREAWMDALGAMGRLPERQRVAVTLRYLEDLPYGGISEATGWPESTCRTLVRRGIGRLGVLLGESDAKGGIR
jgi:RNA polymerase sigma-70 factor (ECF subfamily)